MMAVAVLAVCVITQYYTMYYLPLKDYRAYAIGEDIVYNMKSAEELGKEPPQYMRYYTLKNEATGEMKEVDQDQYIAMYKDTTIDMKQWPIQKELTRDVKIKDGYEPRILDFLALTMEGEDMKDSLLALDKVFLLVAWNLDETDRGVMKDVAAFTNAASDAGIPVFGFSTADYDKSESFRHEYQLAYPFIQGDEKVLKTMIRANPGVMYLEKGKVINMWSGRGLPAYADSQKNGFRP
jgi:hypothetical protein